MICVSARLIQLRLEWSMEKSEFDESAVISACLEGRSDAWKLLIDEYSAMVWAIARNYRLATHDCGDVYQSTWTNVFIHLAQVRSSDRLPAWIATTARRESLKCLNRNSKYLPTDNDAVLDVVGPDIEQPDEAAIRKLMCEQIRASFQLLPPRDQTLLGLLMCDSAPNYDTVSEQLGIPRGSIGPLRRRALTRLRNLLPSALLDGVA